MSPTEKTSRRRRAEKINSEQKKIILQLVACTPEVITHAVTPDFTHHQHQLFWHNITAILNLFGPPRKTPELWKKAWKDYKTRFRNRNVDLMDVLNFVRSENIVDAQLLLLKAERLKTNEERMALRRTIWDSVIDRLPEIVIANFHNNEHTIVEEINTDLDDETSVSNNCESAERLSDLKPEKLDDTSENIVLSIFDGVSRSVSDQENEKSNDAVETLNVESKPVDTRPLDNDLEPDLIEEEASECSLKKRMKLNDVFSNVYPDNSSTKSTTTNRIRSKDSPKNGMKTGVLDELLSEVQKFNKIQAEKLALKKHYVEYKKLMLKNTYIAQKELAKSQLLLATSVKTFVDNISFNS